MYNILNEYPNQKKQLVDFNEFKKLIKPFCRDAIYSLSKGFFDINNIDKMSSFEDLEEHPAGKRRRHSCFCSAQFGSGGL